MRTIPLRNRSGEIIGETLVDDEDFGLLGDEPWCLTNSGYAIAARRSKGSRLMHRVILGLEKGDKRVGDHINRDKLDNRRSNLRILTPAQSNQNQKPAGRRGSSTYRGVTWVAHRRKWRAQWRQRGRPIVIIGVFESEEEAASAASAWRREHLPFAEED